jgi:hypothetical protein
MNISQSTFVNNRCTSDCGGAAAGGAITVDGDATVTTVHIIDSKFIAHAVGGAAAAVGIAAAAAAGGYNDVYQNNTFGGMISFCCPSPPPSATTPGVLASTASSDSKCVPMPTSYLLVDQLPPSQQIVHCPPTPL